MFWWWVLYEPKKDKHTRSAYYILEAHSQHGLPSPCMLRQAVHKSARSRTSRGIIFLRWFGDAMLSSIIWSSFTFVSDPPSGLESDQWPRWPTPACHSPSSQPPSWMLWSPSNHCLVQRSETRGYRAKKKNNKICWSWPNMIYFFLFLLSSLFIT